RSPGYADVPSDGVRRRRPHARRDRRSPAGVAGPLRGVHVSVQHDGASCDLGAGGPWRRRAARRHAAPGRARRGPPAPPRRARLRAGATVPAVARGAAGDAVSGPTTLPELLAGSVERFPDRDALVSARGRWTYRAFGATVERAAGGLARRGV